MAADPFSGKTARDVIANLGRIATALEKSQDHLARIADTLAAMHEADPVAAIHAALAAEQVGPNQTQTTTSGRGTTDADPVNTTTLKPVYGADVPESERWRLG